MAGNTVKLRVMDTFIPPTEGQWLSQYRREGRDGAFQAHLAQRHLLILWSKMARLIAEPILRRLSKVISRG